MKRQPQFLLIAATLALSWLAMQAVHEFGHAMAGIISGGEVKRVTLHPMTVSFTQLGNNPHPLFVAWMGPIVGAALPVVAFTVARACRWRGWYVIQFFAGFCLIANGAYIAIGSLGNVGDAGDILYHGTPLWLLWLFGLTTIPIGLWLWNGLGPYFGLGANAGLVDRAVAYAMVVSLIAVAIVEFLFASPAFNQ